MTDLALAFELPGQPAAAFGALADPYVLRCWYGAPPGYHRVGACGAFVAGGTIELALRAEDGMTAMHVASVRELGPEPRAVLELGWKDLPEAGPATRATVSFAPKGAGTEVSVQQGPFARAEHAEWAGGFWRACFERLARLLAGGVVSPYEELVNESQAFFDPLGVAAFGVLAGLREAGAPPEDIERVEALVYTHLANLAPEVGALLDVVMRERLAMLAGASAGG